MRQPFGHKSWHCGILESFTPSLQSVMSSARDVEYQQSYLLYLDWPWLSCLNPCQSRREMSVGLEGVRILSGLTQFLESLPNRDFNAEDDSKRHFLSCLVLIHSRFFGFVRFYEIRENAALIETRISSWNDNLLVKKDHFTFHTQDDIIMSISHLSFFRFWCHFLIPMKDTFLSLMKELFSRKGKWIHQTLVHLHCLSSFQVLALYDNDWRWRREEAERKDEEYLQSILKGFGKKCNWHVSFSLIQLIHLLHFLHLHTTNKNFLHIKELLRLVSIMRRDCVAAYKKHTTDD
jgi:hypothetical protein